jgi:hypothetical protein
MAASSLPSNPASASPSANNRRDADLSRLPLIFDSAGMVQTGVDTAVKDLSIISRKVSRVDFWEEITYFLGDDALSTPPMAMAQNPFYVSGPVPQEGFVGRKSEINTALDLISKRSHGAFYGISGMGKSSLLRYLADQGVWQEQGWDISQVIILNFNCAHILPFAPQRFWQEILTRLQEDVEEAGLQAVIGAALGEAAIDKGDLRRVLKKIGDQGQFLLLLLDDYDVALYATDNYTETEMLTFLSEFRDLAVHSRESRFLSTIVMTSRKLIELGPKLAASGSPWYNYYLMQPLRPLSLAEVEAHFFASDSPYYLLRPIGITQENLLALTGGHPALLENAGYLLYQQLQMGQHSNYESFWQEFASRTERYFQDIWRFATPEEQVLLMLIALWRLEGRLHQNRYTLEGIDLVLSQRSRELRDLVDRGILQSQGESSKPEYCFASAMMEWWVIRAIENSNEAELTQREKVFARLLSREQAKQFAQVIRQVWQQREAVQSVVRWIIGLFVGTST